MNTTIQLTLKKVHDYYVFKNANKTSWAHAHHRNAIYNQYTVYTFSTHQVKYTKNDFL